jgi:uncharacterized protein (DUF1015 family)
MAIVKPFAALRPKPDLAARICELPYDVLSSAEARELAAGNPLSFLHVSKPEIDLPEGIDLHTPAVYAKGRENFEKLVGSGSLRQDSAPGFYLYRQIMGRHIQVGLVAAASCQEYIQGRIKKHELTRPDKEEDRLLHIETLNSQTGPAFLVYRADPQMNDFVRKQTAATPHVDFTAPDGIRHSSWSINTPGDIEFIEKTFARLPALYIADGHHRSAAAARLFQKREGAGESGYFLAVIFPHDQMQILPYNRVLKDLNGLTPEAILRKLETVFTVKINGWPQPVRPHELGFYFQGQWRTFVFQAQFTASGDALENLDVNLLQKHVIHPIFGIDNPRTSQRINFVGGIRGTRELEKIVDCGEYACAFSMYPTRIEELLAVADSGGIMPPKSTWFEPKLRDAMFCHPL